MCGIFFYQNNNKKTLRYEELKKSFKKSKYRGPDGSHIQYRQTETTTTFLGFHRLKINDVTSNGNQPFEHNNSSLICNGEIYNFKELIYKYNLNCKSNSDCEVIIHLYQKIGFIETVKELDGVFAIVLIDNNSGIVYCARDPIGVRSMYMYNDNGIIAVASELKSLVNLRIDNTKITQFTPCHVWNSTHGYTKYWNIQLKCNQLSNIASIAIIKTNIVNLLINAVKKRMISDRPIGCLLSGGLDSSLIASILCKLLKEKNGCNLKTFSVGLVDSPDLKHARDVAAYIGSDHHELILTESQMINGIEKTIYHLETYDTTTIRAGTPMYLLGKYIKENFDTTVIFSGEGSDELSGSYLYFHNAPNKLEFQTEIHRLVEDLSYFDVLRCDKTISANGLEVRVPFLDKEFASYYIAIDPKYKLPQMNRTGKMEKHLLRHAFDNGLLPSHVLWRKKEGMSDGVSSQNNSWYSIIQAHVEKLPVSENPSQYTFNQPMFKESLYYRDIFTKYFPGCEKTIPYYWLPKWSGDVVDPSARILPVY